MPAESSFLADDSGPRLFRIDWWFHQFHYSEFGYFKKLPKHLDDERWEAPDPPPFFIGGLPEDCLLYTSPSPRDA